MDSDDNPELDGGGESILDKLKLWNKILRGKKPIYTAKGGTQIKVNPIGDEKSIPFLTDLLEDAEPTIQWDAAIALAKLGDISGVFIIENLLDREYLNAFPEVDEVEKDQAIMVAIKVSSRLKDDRFVTKLVGLAKSDVNLKIRDAALKTLQSTYNRVI